VDLGSIDHHEESTSGPKLAAALMVVALIGFVFFVAEAPTAAGGRLRLSDGEAALFRSAGMLADEPPAAGSQEYTVPRSGMLAGGGVTGR
jgi:hypothetical protein